RCPRRILRLAALQNAKHVCEGGHRVIRIRQLANPPLMLAGRLRLPRPLTRNQPHAARYRGADLIWAHALSEKVPPNVREDSGDHVMPLYERHKPDLVFLDIVMPGKDGVTAATELLARYPHAVVVMCTSLTTRDKVLACQKAGVSHYLLKPFQADRAVAVMKH